MYKNFPQSFHWGLAWEDGELYIQVMAVEKYLLIQQLLWTTVWVTARLSPPANTGGESKLTCGHRQRPPKTIAGYPKATGIPIPCPTWPPGALMSLYRCYYVGYLKSRKARWD